MKIWKIEDDFKEYESFQLTNKDRAYYREFKQKIISAKRLNGEYDNVPIELIEGREVCDFPKFWGALGVLMISERARKCLEDIIGRYVEFIPVCANGKPYYIVNLLNVLDAVDYSKSVFRVLDTGLVVGLEKYAFSEDRLQGNDMFKILLNGRIYSTEIFVSDKIKQTIEENGLSGVKFIKVWESD